MSMSIPDEINDPQVPAMHLATAPICASNKNIEEEKMSPQLTAMPLPAGSRRLDDYDYDANEETELDLPSKGSVLVVDSSCVPAEAQDLSNIDFQELVNNGAIQRRFRTSNPDEGASLVEIDEPVEVPSFSSRTLFFTGQASFT